MVLLRARAGVGIPDAQAARVPGPVDVEPGTNTDAIERLQGSPDTFLEVLVLGAVGLWASPPDPVHHGPDDDVAAKRVVQDVPSLLGFARLPGGFAVCGVSVGLLLGLALLLGRRSVWLCGGLLPGLALLLGRRSVWLCGGLLPGLALLLGRRIRRSVWL